MKARVKLLRDGASELRLDGKSERLTPVETIILFALMCRKRIHRDELREILWPNPNMEPDWSKSSIGVRMCNLRRKLAQFGIYISNLYCFGWRLEMNNQPRRLGRFTQYVAA